MKNIAVIGSGSWGIALATYLARNDNNVKIWSFLEEECKNINENHKSNFLPTLEIPSTIKSSTSFEEVLNNAEIILLVTPSKFVRETIKKFKNIITNQKLVICSKGFESETLNLLTDVAKEELPNTSLAVLSGPSHAEEVAFEKHTALVVASENKELLEEIQNLFMSEIIRVYTSSDIRGVEIGGALKNVIAFCAGISSGIGMGDNAFAALITRGLVEITRLGTAMGGKKDTFYGLTGLGDLIVTCMSLHSRNRKAGLLIGQGYTLEETKSKVGMTIESIDNIESAYKLSKKYDIEMPIVEAAYDILYNNLDPKLAVNNLMTRKQKSE